MLNDCGMMNLHTNLLDNKRLYPWRICKQLGLGCKYGEYKRFL